MSYGRGFVGSKYEATKHLDTTGVAKEFRAELKAEFPRYKFSVRTRKFAGGSAIDCELVKAPGLRVVPTEGEGRYSDECMEVLKKVKAMLDAYIYDDSDTMSDYFHVRFYIHVNLDWRLERDATAAEKASASVAEAPKVDPLASMSTAELTALVSF